MKIYKLILLLLLFLTACERPQQPNVTATSPITAQSELPQAASSTPETQPTTKPVSSPTPTTAPQEELEPSPTATPTEVPVTDTEDSLPPVDALSLGPDQFSPGVNPLTGLPVENPELLSLPPALISITNFPVSARPQAGLSFAPYVYEMYIGEGMTRFLALFYGQYPQLSNQTPDTSVVPDNQAEIGPVRSGRLPHQAIRQLYNGFLVMASASSEVTETTTDFTNIFGTDTYDINSALIDVSQFQSIAESHKTALEINLTGNLFNSDTPDGGREAKSLWVFYSFLNQVKWEYQDEGETYLRYQDIADGSGNFYPATDRLTDEQLAFENVILLFVNHQVLNNQGTLIDVDLLFSEGYAYLFRNGKIFPIYWTTLGDDYEKTTGRLRPIRFTDREGNPIPLKPGSTWIELVDLTTTFEEIEPGSWKARFYAP